MYCKLRKVQNVNEESKLSQPVGRQEVRFIHVNRNRARFEFLLINPTIYFNLIKIGRKEFTWLVQLTLLNSIKKLNLL